MRTQITCPRCQTPYSADVHQIIDVGQQPRLKELLLSGALNVAQCPNCGAVTQVATPMLYHDPEHELFMVHVPMEMSLPQAEQERMIGDLVRQAMDQLPAEKRRGYMLQPQTIISMQRFLEKILETEGVTPEMLARQRKQAELLEQLLAADKQRQTELIEENADEIDETFFAMLRSMMEMADNANQEERSLKLLNLQAKLYRDTEYGRKLERQQQALHALSREAKKEDGLTPKLLLKHILANRSEPLVVDALVAAGQAALNYEFFMLLSERIEKRKKANLKTDDLEQLRDRLLAYQQSLEQESRQIVEAAQDTLREILEAGDPQAAVRDRIQDLDETFLYVLSAHMAEAERRGDKDYAAELARVQTAVMDEIERQAPPEIRLFNQLMRQTDEAEQRRLLSENEQLVTPEFVEMLEAIGEQVGSSRDEEFRQRLKKLQQLVKARVALQ